MVLEMWIVVFWIAMPCDVLNIILNSSTCLNQSCLCGRCSGLKDADFEFGSCSEKDPCDPNPCSDDKQCVPARKVCLSMLHKPCPQYQCGKCTCLSHFVSLIHHFAQTNIQFQFSVMYSKTELWTYFSSTEVTGGHEHFCLMVRCSEWGLSW
jgi:hypothetical protein